MNRRRKLLKLIKLKMQKKPRNGNLVVSSPLLGKAGADEKQRELVKRI